MYDHCLFESYYDEVYTGCTHTDCGWHTYLAEKTLRQLMSEYSAHHYMEHSQCPH